MNLFPINEVQLMTAFFVLVRVSAIIALLPLFGDRTVPPTIKVLFSVAMSFVVFPTLWQSGLRFSDVKSQSTGLLVGAVVSELFVGLLLGFFARWIFDAVRAAGYFMGTQMGFSMGSVLDPTTETQTIALAEFQYGLAALLFLAMDGHHVYVNSIMDSFRLIPLGELPVLSKGDTMIRTLIDLTEKVLLLSVHLAAPVLIVMLLVNLAFGLVSRAVPQINMLVISFAANILVGLMIFAVSLPGFHALVGTQFEEYSQQLRSFMTLLGN
ncbi:MAG TPA: flagellar biosynthetic protein FliR [Oligoflexia bacterium]|mgnify:CR=1 FL=1|nr:flagellar biosynthetic protein FliR [Oligoflexia bacterium]